MIDVLSPALRAAIAGLPAEADPCLVGGCVRDWLLGVAVADFDVEVFGVAEEALIRSLAPHGRIDAVGRSFGVLKVTLSDGCTHDFSIPRRDSKVGAGHRGFIATPDPGLTKPEAAARRDYTLNSMMWRVRTGELLDFFGGQRDLQGRVLRHTSPAFTEDPLRVLRGMQFAGRFGLSAAPETLALCRQIRGSLAELAGERIREEWIKWAAKSSQPSAGLRFLRETGWLEHYPELAGLVGVMQDAEWHPEGDVWTHTLHCMDALAGLAGWRAAGAEQRVTLSLAVLLHDIGKPSCTRAEEREGRMRIVSPGHEVEGRRMTEGFLARIRAPGDAAAKVPALVANHMVRFGEVSPRAIRRLAHRLSPATISDLLLVMTADCFGRPPLPAVVAPAVEDIRRVADSLALADQAPRPILLGRHLVARGMTPGPAFKEWLDRAFEAQLTGEFSDPQGAAEWLDARLGAGVGTAPRENGPGEAQT